MLFTLCCVGHAAVTLVDLEGNCHYKVQGLYLIFQKIFSQNNYKKVGDFL